jgi:ElaB/YqjD/DUF883 family membrane-anchored ribosome-binding protein
MQDNPSSDADALRASATAALDAAAGLAREAVAPARKFVAERPIAALAIAFAAGWLLGKRR